MLFFDMSFAARSPCPLLSVVSKHSTHSAWVMFCVTAPCFYAARWWGRVWGVRFLVRVFLFGRVARLSQSGQSGVCVTVGSVAGILSGRGKWIVFLFFFLFFSYVFSLKESLGVPFKEKT